MDIIAVDQHNKWKWFNLWLHVGLDPFTGRIAWIHIWWTNQNTHLIAAITSMRAERWVFLLLSRAIQALRISILQIATPTFATSLTLPLQICCSTAGCESIKMSNLKHFGLSSTGNRPLVLRLFLTMSSMKAELDKWRAQHNSMPHQADRNKVLPHGIPNVIHAKLHMYDSEDFTVKVSP
ncbi:hypothetical protein DFH09DRAFT_1097817 [Mycena vulgaris]|nr:hypothetical protein DFH09DRAFT_1097817 [Mycena vulgaris]